MQRPDPRKVDAATFWRVAKNTLGRMACAYLDPTDPRHNHAECLRDDEAYAADLMLGLLAAAAAGDEDGVLERLSEVMDATAAST